MKIFIWLDHVNKEYPKLTNNYHPGGGLVVICQSHEAIKEAIMNYNAQCSWYLDKVEEQFINDLPIPDYTYDIDTNENKVFLFPDSGCC